MKDSVLSIRALRLRPVAVPMRLPLQTSTGAVSIAPLVLIDLETTAGITGRSYLFAIGMPNLKPIVALLDAMGEILGGDPVAPFEIERKLRRKYTLLGVHNIVLIAMAGIDMAAWDAYAQSLGQPLVKVLGGTPRPVIDRLHREITRILRTPEVSDKLLGVNFEMVASTPEQFDAWIRKEIPLWAKVIKQTGAKAGQ